MAGRVVHFEVPYEDQERASSFYSEAFGWSLMPMPEMSYTLVTTGPTGEKGPEEPGFINGGMMQREAAFAGPVLVIDVDDIDSSLARIEELGGTGVQPKAPVGEMGYAAYFKDPEGNLMGLWQNA